MRTLFKINSLAAAYDHFNFIVKLTIARFKCQVYLRTFVEFTLNWEQCTLSGLKDNDLILFRITILARKMKDVDGTICKLETIIMEKIYDQIEQLSHMWNEVGIFEDPLEDRCNSIADQVVAFMGDLVEDEENRIRDLKAGTDKLSLKIISLCQDLNLSFDEVSIPSFKVINRVHILFNCLMNY